MAEWVTAPAIGIATRNGTANHTISFTAAAAGNLLVAVVGAGVTNSMTTGGWTEQLQPVNNCELSVFTKYASSGESSFVVNHNASNYPLAYCVMEFPSSCTYAGGTGSANVSAWPTLSGLSGRNTVIGVLVEAHSSGDPAYSATWSAPWTELVDQETPFSSTDGVFMTLGYQDGYTSVTAQPGETDSTNRTDERVVFAISSPLTVYEAGSANSDATAMMGVR